MTVVCGEQDTVMSFDFSMMN